MAASLEEVAAKMAVEGVVGAAATAALAGDCCSSNQGVAEELAAAEVEAGTKSPAEEEAVAGGKCTAAAAAEEAADFSAGHNAAATWTERSRCRGNSNCPAFGCCMGPSHRRHRPNSDCCTDRAAATAAGSESTADRTTIAEGTA